MTASGDEFEQMVNGPRNVDDRLIVFAGTPSSAGVVKLADARDSKSRDLYGREGSTPSSGTI
jgi:hypothetical protein